MMRFALVAPALCSLALLACNGCNATTTPPAAQPDGAANVPAAGPVPPSPSGPGAPAGETVIHVEDDGHAVDVPRGATVAFKLASRAGTGFEWNLAPTFDQRILAPQGPRTSELSSPTPGAPKMDVFRLTATTPGSTVVQAELKRPFGDAPPAQVVHVTVNVH